MAELTIDEISQALSDFKLDPHRFEIVLGCVMEGSEAVRIRLRGTSLEFQIHQCVEAGRYFCRYSGAQDLGGLSERWPRETSTDFNVLLFRFGHWLRNEVIPYGVGHGLWSADPAQLALKS